MVPPGRVLPEDRSTLKDAVWLQQDGVRPAGQHGNFYDLRSGLDEEAIQADIGSMTDLLDLLEPLTVSKP